MHGRNRVGRWSRFQRQQKKPGIILVILFFPGGKPCHKALSKVEIREDKALLKIWIGEDLANTPPLKILNNGLISLSTTGSSVQTNPVRIVRKKEKSCLQLAMLSQLTKRSYYK